MAAGDFNNQIAYNSIKTNLLKAVEWIEMGNKYPHIVEEILNLCFYGILCGQRDITESFLIKAQFVVHPSHKRPYNGALLVIPSKQSLNMVNNCTGTKVYRWIQLNKWIYFLL